MSMIYDFCLLGIYIYSLGLAQTGSTAEPSKRAALHSNGKVSWGLKLGFIFERRGGPLRWRIPRGSVEVAAPQHMLG